MNPNSAIRNPKWGGLAALLPLFVALLPLWAASAALGGDPGAEGDLYVSGYGSVVVQYDGPTGAYVADFVPEGSGCYPIGLTFGPNGNLFVSSYTDEVIEFDGTTGALIGTFASGGGLDDPIGLTFGPNGNLFVSNNTDEVIEYDGTTGALIGTFASGGGLDDPIGLVFGPNGNLFVSNSSSNVIEFDGASGVYVGDFVPPGSGGLYGPEGLVFGPNGNLFVASRRTDEVIEYDGATGDLIGTFASQGLKYPQGIAFGPDGSLFVVSSTASSGYGITQHYGNTGALVRTIAEGYYLTFLTFKPLAGPFPQPSVTGFAPPQAGNGAPLAGATVTGTGLVWGAQLRLTRAGEPDILGAITGLTPDTAITASFDLSGAAPGLWDLLLTYPDDQTFALVDALEILACPPPVVTAIDPAAADDCFGIRATITGSGFLFGVSGATTVKLCMAGEPNIDGANVQVQNPSTVTADFDLTTAAAGLWDVVAANYGSEGDPLVGAVEVSPCPLPEVTAFAPAWVDVGSLNMSSGGLLAGATITGAGFTVGATVKLTMAGQDIAGGNAEVQSSTTLVADFYLGAAALGLWDVVVTRPDSETATLVGGVELVDSDQRIRLVGAWGGSVEAIFVEQNGDQRLAYIGSGVRLVILDVTDPAAIIELGSVLLEGILRDVEVRDGYAFIASTMPAYFSVVDVSDPSNPVLVSTGNTCSVHGPGYDGLAFWGDVVYATKSNGTTPGSFDVSNPTNPVPRCRDMYGCDDLLFEGDVGYLVSMTSRPETYEGAAWTVDMSEHGASHEYPPILSLGYFTEMFSHAGALTPIGLYGQYLYVIAHKDDPDIHSLLFVVDMSDPDALAIVGTWGDASGELLLYGAAMSISDGRLYWAGPGRFDPLSRTMVILDIGTDPTTPTLLGEYVSDAVFKDIFVLGTTAYLGDTREGLTILDCSDPANPQRVGNYFSPAVFYRGALDGDQLYVTDYSYGVSILDVSDPRTPRLKGKWETGTYTPDRTRMCNWGIAVRDDRAYVAAGHGGFQVLDVSDPAAPTLAGSFANWPEGFRSVGLALSPDEPIVHLGTIPGAWIVNMDVSDPTNIVDVGAVFIDGYAAKPLTIVRRPDGIGYVARDGVLVTVDLSDPVGPLLLGSTGPQSYDLGINGNGNILFATNDSSAGIRGCAILDVATVDHLPVPIAYYTYDDPRWLKAHAVTVVGPRAYLGVETNSDGLMMQVVDVSDPASPFLLQQVTTGTAQIYDLIVDGATVYAVTESWSSVGGGVQVYQVYVPGDMDDDGEIGPADAAAFASCFTGPDIEPSDATCLIGDFDGDNDIDCDDWEAFKLAWTAPGSPPSFGPCDCPEDLVPPPGVEQQDLNAVLNRWGDPACELAGPDYPCPEDLALPDGVEQQDLNAVLNRWGDPTCAPAPGSPGRWDSNPPTPGKPKRDKVGSTSGRALSKDRK